MGFVGVAIIIILFVGFVYIGKVNRLVRRVSQLEADVNALRSGAPVMTAPSLPATPPRPAVTPPPKRAAPRPVQTEEEPVSTAAPLFTHPVPVTVAREQAPPTPPPFPRLPSPVDAWFQTARSTDEWEQLIGGRWLNLIGALALILGAGFFLKYAFDHDWISPSLRVTMGLVAGMALLGVAYRAYRRDYVIFSQGLVGAGISILYLSVYASFNFYHLIPQSVALVAMALVTVIGFFQAIYYNSLAISLLAWFGGFLTPVLLMSAGASEVGLATYLALLVSGLLLLVALKDEWFILEPLTMAGAFFIYLLWYATSYTSSSLGLAVAFAGILWALFYAKDVSDIVRNIGTYPQVRHWLGASNSVFYYIMLLALLLPDHRAWTAAASLILAAVYCATILGAARVTTVARSIAIRYALTAIVLLVLATAIQFSGFTLAILWAIEAVLLLEVGRRWQWWYVWEPALGLYALAALRQVTWADAWSFPSVGQFHPLLNERAAAYVVLAAAAAVSAFLASRVRDARLSDSGRRNLVQLLLYTTCALPFILLAVETNDFFRSQMLHASGLDSTELGYVRFLAIGAVWAVYATILLAAGLRLKLEPLMLSGLGACAAAVVAIMVSGVRFLPIERFTPVVNPRVGVFAVLAAALFLQLWWIDRRLQSASWSNAVSVCIRATLLVLGFELLTVEVNDYFSRLIADSGGVQATNYGFVRTMIVTGLWTLYSLPIVRYGVVKRQIFTITAALSTVGLAALIGASVGFQYPSIGWFVPILNARAATFLLLLVGLFVHLRTLQGALDIHPWMRRFVFALQGAIVLLGFELITVETRDFFTHLIAGSSGLQATSYGFMRTMIIAGLWMLYSLPIIRYGVVKRQIFTISAALATAGLATLLGASVGAEYQPLRWFFPLLNIRAAAFLVLLAGLFVSVQAVRRAPDIHPWMRRFGFALEGAIVLLGFEMVTVEINDFFQRAVVMGNSLMGSASDIHNIEQVSLSVAWLLYAVLLMGIGIWKRSRWLRFGALALFAVTILKVFFYDLSFLTGAYRSISFAGLGVILLAVSFLYQRFRTLLFGPGQEPEHKPPKRQPPHGPHVHWPWHAA